MSGGQFFFRWNNVPGLMWCGFSRVAVDNFSPYNMSLITTQKNNNNIKQGNLYSARKQASGFHSGIKIK